MIIIFLRITIIYLCFQSLLVHPVDEDLNFLYVALDPPPLTTEGLATTRSRSRQLQQPFHHIRASSSNALLRHSATISDDCSKQRKFPKSRPPANETVTTNLDDNGDDTEREESSPLSDVTRRLSVSCEALEMHPPAAFRMRCGDWISVMPMGFYNIWKDGLVSMFCSTSSLSDSDEVLDQFVEGSMKRSEKMSILQERIPRSNLHDNYSLLKGKVEANVLQSCQSGAVQLVYFSKFKNCPQGYSEIIKVGLGFLNLYRSIS